MSRFLKKPGCIGKEINQQWHLMKNGKLPDTSEIRISDEALQP
jgi:hypothetical protein